MSDTNCPHGWVIAPLGDIALWGSGGTPSRKNPEYYGGEIPWVKTGDLGPKILSSASEFITESAVQNSSAKFFPKGSVAIAMYGATIGKTSILGIDATTNQACAVGQPIPECTSTEFLFYLLRNEKDNFIAKGKGGAQPNISQTLIKDHHVLFPSLAEQKQVVANLDKLLAQVDPLKTRLDTTPSILKRFRQSVLAAAVSGRLTEEWRKINNVSPGSKVALGTVGYVLAGQSPSRAEVNTDGKGEPYVTGPEQWDGRKILHNKWTEYPKRMAPNGSIFVTVKGAGVGTTFPGCYAAIGRDVYAFVTNNDVVYDYILYSIQSSAQEVVLKAKGLIPGLTKADIVDHNIYLPSTLEQTEIVRRIEQLFTFADQIEQRVKDAQFRVNKLTQSILAKAFRGELTAEWREQNLDLISGENSAKALLNRIEVERQLASSKKQTRKKRA